MEKKILTKLKSVLIPIWHLVFRNPRKFYAKKNIKHMSKIGFVINAADMLGHYENIWKHIPKNNFEIIYATDKSQQAQILKFAETNNYRVLSIERAIKRRHVYKTLVSHHVGAGGYIKHLGGEAVSFLGERHIRMLYALGKSGWNLAKQNQAYDFVLCYGKQQIDLYKTVTNAKLIPVGYPRFDTAFSIKPEALKNQLNLDKHKKTVLWLPTWGDLCSIPAFAKNVGVLTKQYNVIVKIHFLTNEAQKQALKEAGLNYISEDCYNNSHLIALSDYILCDYGGSMFGALYMNKNILLLNLKSADEHELFKTNDGSQSLDLSMRNHITNVNAQEDTDLKSIIANDMMWTEQAIERAKLHKKLFSPFYGARSGEVAARSISLIHEGKELEINKINMETEIDDVLA